MRTWKQPRDDGIFGLEIFAGCAPIATLTPPKTQFRTMKNCRYFNILLAVGQWGDNHEMHFGVRR
jgi:hypothetical protein